MAKTEVALVLGSGGARGMAHIGVIDALLESGYTIRSVAGSSIGAVVGGFFSAGMLEPYREWMVNLDKMDVFRLLDFTVSKQGLIRGEKVFSEMKKILPDRQIEHFSIPFAAVAVDITGRKEVIFDKGSLYRAMRASVAIPSILLPVYEKGKTLVDGGLLNPLPVNLVKRKPGQLIIAVDLNSDDPVNRIAAKKENQEEESALDVLIEKFRMKFGKKHKTDAEAEQRLGYFHLMINSFELMQEKLTSMRLESQPPDILVKIPRTLCSTFEFYRAKELIDYGREEMLKVLGE